jgi:serine/threonine protein kinase
MTDKPTIDQILDRFKQRGYIIDPQKIGQGAFASVYRAHRDYAIRISKDNPDEYDKSKAIDHLNRKICTRSHKLPFKNTHILCTESTEKIGDYLVEILQGFDMDLSKYLTSERMVGNTITYHDRITFYELAMLNNGLKYLKNFNAVAGSMLDTITMLHDNNLAHGDIKPSNILIKLNATDSNEIENFAVSDFDTLCVGIRNIFTDVFECEISPATPLFSTTEMSSQNKHGKRYDINIKKRSDIYAINLVILMMWHGYIKFLSIFDGNYNTDRFFESRFQDLSKNTPEMEIKRTEFFRKLRLANDRKFNNITTLYGKRHHNETIEYTERLGHIVETFHIIKNSTDILERLMFGRSVILPQAMQTGGFYDVAYDRYKQRYLRLKFEI